ncbi:hypothetical protein F2P81_020134 [Scophthalmus maximus]|uniref:Uncharacterized protein n=1 Tax=Scophthalmus maximus TaxID=52904 RepID=A0A6A4RZA3_SCOMX|nr:hypothetical protein F2P81_020134 [Scophthalmus maximus]
MKETQQASEAAQSHNHDPAAVNDALKRSFIELWSSSDVHIARSTVPLCFEVNVNEQDNVPEVFISLIVVTLHQSVKITPKLVWFGAVTGNRMLEPRTLHSFSKVFIDAVKESLLLFDVHIQNRYICALKYFSQVQGSSVLLALLPDDEQQQSYRGDAAGSEEQLQCI